MDRDSILRLPTQTDAAGRESDAPHPGPRDAYVWFHEGSFLNTTHRNLAA